MLPGAGIVAVTALPSAEARSDSSKDMHARRRWQRAEPKKHG